MIGDRVRQAREYGEYSLDIFSEKLGISKRTLQNYEKNNNEPTASTIINIANFCHIDEWWLLTGKGSMLELDTNPDVSTSTYSLKTVTTYKASAGSGNEINSITVYETGKTMQIDKAFFKTPPSKTLRVIQVDGYSMVPMLLPDSWVIFDEIKSFTVDGLYIINYSGQLMVKLLQLDPSGILQVISKNKDYKSYEINLKQNNEHFSIVGKVVRVIM